MLQRLPASYQALRLFIDARKRQIGNLHSIAILRTPLILHDLLEATLQLRSLIIADIHHKLHSFLELKDIILVARGVVDGLAHPVMVVMLVVEVG